MSDTPKTWGTIQTDDDTNTSFISVSPETTVRVAGNQIKDRDHARYVYLVIPQADKRFIVVRWIEIEQLAATAGAAILDRRLGEALAGKAPVESFERGRISYRDALTLRRNQPGQRVVVLEGGQVVGVFAPETRSGDSNAVLDLLSILKSASTPATGTGVLGAEEEDTPTERQINAWIDGGKGPAANPLVKNKRYILHFDVDLPRKEGLVQGLTVSSLQEFADTPDQASVAMTFMLEADPEQVQILGAQEATIPVPIEVGPSEYEALFQIKPLVAGAVELRAFVLVKDQVLQKIKLMLTSVETPEAAEAAAVNINALSDTKPIAVASGRTLGSIPALRPRSNPISLIITPTTTGYDLLLTGGVAARARITLNDYGVAQEVQKARNELRKIVYGSESGNKSYLLGWDIPAEVHHATMEQLAMIGRSLFRNLFQKSGPDAKAMGDLVQKLSLDGVQLNIEIVAQNFIFPWALVYDKPANQPAAADGFWGFKHIIHHLPESNAPAPVAFQPVIKVGDALDLTFVFNEGIDAQMGRPLIASQREFFQNDLPGIKLTERNSEDQLINDLANPDTPVQILYLYCHAESFVPGERDKFNLEQFTSDSRLLISTKKGLSVSMLEDKTDISVALKSAPFVYMNACQGAELSPFMAGEGLVPFFIRKGARGVLGTECDTPALFAAEFAKRFLKRFVEGGTTMGDLLLDLRKEFLTKHNNVMGLLYSLYSSGDVSVERAA